MNAKDAISVYIAKILPVLKQIKESGQQVVPRLIAIDAGGTGAEFGLSTDNFAVAQKSIQDIVGKLCPEVAIFAYDASIQRNHDVLDENDKVLSRVASAETGIFAMVQDPYESYVVGQTYTKEENGLQWKDVELFDAEALHDRFDFFHSCEDIAAV